MKSPMHAMEEILKTTPLKYSPRAKELLTFSVGALRNTEERLIREAYEAGRNSIKGADPKISERKSGEYFNNKFEL